MASPAHPTPLDRRPVLWMLAASLISGFGNAVSLIAVPWFVLDTTGSARDAGLVATASLAPFALAALFGGVITDRMSHRRLSIGSDLLSGLTVAMIPLLHLTIGISLPGLMLLAFLGALFDAPGMNARGAMIPRLARGSGIALERVNSGLSIGRSLVLLLGTPLAGGLIAVIGPANALWVNAAAFAVSAAIFAFGIPATPDPPAATTSMRDDLREGFAFIFRDPLLRGIALTATALNAVLSPVIAIGVPVYVREGGHQASTFGLLMTSIALGGLSGAGFYGWVGPRLNGRLTVTASLAMLVLPLFVVAAQPGLLLMWVALFVMQVGAGIVNPVVFTFFQRNTPERLLGRAMGTLTATAMIAAPLGMAIGGVVIEAFGVGTMAMLGAVVLIATSAPLLIGGALRGLDTQVQRNPAT